ncbi:MAG: NAD(+) synthase [Cryomorphaceae bacterium]
MQAEKISQHIADWLRNYALSAGAKGFTIGVSGGIDSAVTSTLAAMTGLPVLCLEMPIHQPESHVSRARKHIEYLEERFPAVKSQFVELTPVFEAFINTLPPAEDKDKHEFSLVNARARLRMSTLYYFAALHGYLVAGTGNKVEDFGVGFYTKYGDGGVDLSPIADLMKTEVFALGAHLGIIEEIMKAPPTDGLWGDDRTDEDQIGATYPELEWAMEFDGDESKLSEREETVLNIYRDHHRRNKHKMVEIPVCEIPQDMKG